MAKIHVLANEAGKYEVIIHFNTPAGNNSAGVSWKEAAIADGAITQTAHALSDAGDVADIEAGDIIEIGASLKVNPEGMDGAAIVAGLDALADVKIANWIANNSARLKYYGYSQGVVS